GLGRLGSAVVRRCVGGVGVRGRLRRGRGGALGRGIRGRGRLAGRRAPPARLGRVLGGRSGVRRRVVRTHGRGRGIVARRLGRGLRGRRRLTVRRVRRYGRLATAARLGLLGGRGLRGLN